MEPLATAPSDARWAQDRFVVKERLFTLGRQYHILDASGRLVAYCKQKSFKLREDIRFYADETMRIELFRLEATRIIDFSGSFRVIDSATKQELGRLRRKGWKSLVRDEWEVVGPTGDRWGILREDSQFLAIVRRFVLSILPAAYDLFRDGDAGVPVASIRERFQFYGDTYDLRVAPGVDLDRRVLIGLTVCVDAIEGE